MTDFLLVLLAKADGTSWTSEDHFILAFDSNRFAGSRIVDLAPGVEFARPVDYLLRCAVVSASPRKGSAAYRC